MGGDVEQGKKKKKKKEDQEEEGEGEGCVDMNHGH